MAMLVIRYSRENTHASRNENQGRLRICVPPVELKTGSLRLRFPSTSPRRQECCSEDSFGDLSLIHSSRASVYHFALLSANRRSSFRNRARKSPRQSSHTSMWFGWPGDSFRCTATLLHRSQIFMGMYSPKGCRIPLRHSNRLESTWPCLTQPSCCPCLGQLPETSTPGPPPMPDRMDLKPPTPRNDQGPCPCLPSPSASIPQTIASPGQDAPCR